MRAGLRVHPRRRGLINCRRRSAGRLRFFTRVRLRFIPFTERNTTDPCASHAHRQASTGACLRRPVLANLRADRAAHRGQSHGMVPELPRDRAGTACTTRGASVRRRGQAHAHRSALFRSRPSPAHSCKTWRATKAYASIRAKPPTSTSSAGRIAQPADRARRARAPRKRHDHRAVGERDSRRMDQLQDR